MTLQFFGEIIGYVGIILAIFAYIEKNDKRCLILNIFVSVTWALHYTIFAHFSAAGILVYDAAKTGLAVKYKQNIPILVISILGSIIIGILTYDGTLISQFPIATSIIWSVAAFILEKSKMRFVFLLVMIMWCIYNFFVGSIPGIIGTSIVSIAIIIGILRIQKPAKKN